MIYKNVIIGFGKGGKTLAFALAKKGESVALIEKSSKMYGGTCINEGCIPSKALADSAFKSASNQGDDFTLKSVKYAQAVARKNQITSLLREKNYKKLADLNNVTIYDGIGSFAGAHSVEVLLNDGGRVLLEAERIFIDTGSKTFLPDIPGISDNPCVYTSSSLMNESRLPRKLIIIGAGYIGMEFASTYANFGSEVIILHDGVKILPKEDQDVADEIKSIYEKRGITFITEAKVFKLDKDSVCFLKNNKEYRLKADAILIAAGRRPQIEELRLEKAGIELTARNAIKVDPLLRTSVPGVWALGDVNGGPQFTFVSLDDFRIVMSQLENKAPRLRQNLAYCVFMDTPLARIGITEDQAKAQGLDFKVFKMPASAVPKSHVLGKTAGFLKVIVNNKDNTVLGAALLCAEAYEMINLLKFAMDFKVDIDYLKNNIYTHPTMSEAFNDLF